MPGGIASPVPQHTPELLGISLLLFLPMSKQHYFGRLIPPRPTFPGDMTAAEGALMAQHAKYTRERFEAGKILIYGPVMAKGGAFGMAVLEVADESEARRFFENDPTVRAGMNRFEIHPMQVAAARAQQV